MWDTSAPVIRQLVPVCKADAKLLVEGTGEAKVLQQQGEYLGGDENRNGSVEK